MYEQDSTKLLVARGAVTVEHAVQVWTGAEKDRLALQAIALMDHAGVPFPPGTLDDFVSIRVPAPQLSGVDTEFHPWNKQELQRNGLLFSELRQSLSDYWAYWQGQVPMSEQAFAGVLVVLNRTGYP